MPLYAAVKNPYFADLKLKRTLSRYSPQEIAAFTKLLKSKGYDGVVLNLDHGLQELVAFEPGDVKSAVGNNGEFNGNDPRVNRSAESTDPTRNNAKNYNAQDIRDHIEKVLGKSVKLAWATFTHAGQFDRAQAGDFIRLFVAFVKRLSYQSQFSHSLSDRMSSPPHRWQESLTITAGADHFLMALTSTVSKLASLSDSISHCVPSGGLFLCMNSMPALQWSNTNTRYHIFHLDVLNDVLHCGQCIGVRSVMSAMSGLLGYEASILLLPKPAIASQKNSQSMLLRKDGSQSA